MNKRGVDSCAFRCQTDAFPSVADSVSPTGIGAQLTTVARHGCALARRQHKEIYMIRLTGSSASRRFPALATAAVLATVFASPVSAHITYSGRNFGTITTSGSTIAGQAVSSSFGWADATDGDWGDSHRFRAFRFTLTGTQSVAITAQRQNLVTGTATGQQTGNHDTLLPAFSVFSGLSHTSAPFAHDSSSLSVEWLRQQFGTTGVAEDYTDGNSNGRWDPGENFTDTNANGVWDSANLGNSGKEGSLNALGAWSIGNSLLDYPAASSGSDSLRSFSFAGYAADGSSTNFGATPGLVGDGNADGFVTTTLWNLAPGDYSIFVGGGNYAAQLTETATFGAAGNAFPTYGLTVTVAPVPEPGAFVLAAIGIGAAWVGMRRRGAVPDRNA
jgi:hypothetical protein